MKTFLFFFLLSLISYNNSGYFPYGHCKVFRPKIINGKKHGWETTCFGKHWLSSRNWKNGKLNGLMVYWSRGVNPKPFRRGFYRNGKKHGLFYSYDRSYRYHYYRYYINDKPCGVHKFIRGKLVVNKRLISCYKIRDKTRRSVFPPHIWKILQSNSKILVYQLDPALYRPSLQLELKKRMKGIMFLKYFKVLLLRPVVYSAFKEILIDGLLQGVINSSGGYALCFNPRHAIEFKSSLGKVLFIICYECNGMQVFFSQNDKSYNWKKYKKYPLSFAGMDLVTSIINKSRLKTSKMRDNH